MLEARTNLNVHGKLPECEFPWVHHQTFNRVLEVFSDLFVRVTLYSVYLWLACDYLFDASSTFDALPKLSNH